MSGPTTSRSASATLRPLGDRLELALGGEWRITGDVPRWTPPDSAGKPAALSCRVDEGLFWDSSLVFYLSTARAWCTANQVAFETAGLPANLLTLLGQLDSAGPAPTKERGVGILSLVGLGAQDLGAQFTGLAHFVGECSISAVRLVRNPRLFRWKDCLDEMQQCGAMALPIVSLVSFLVGVTLAYTAAIILRLFGGDIWVADLIGLSVTREMGAVMTGVVLAGRTGAAYAAHLGNMKANEEIDALSTLGVEPVDFLVVPRMVALALMTPLLALYANLLGILGGMIIALGILSIPPTAYWVELVSIVDLSDVTTGLIKASVFGLIIGMSGCLRGLQADRSAAGVGRAATSAVVTAIILMVIADALFAVIFNIVGW
ncbi:putative phospholipid ABC transporter permease protein MlaE [mine drainage metagenome]|uniref:Putative phospholipid ABC transporter permease protein MlaE n=1 Tax=mine drainage metagenome TaxID=410659 RepID=A0A1J5SK02_9ZZZZ